MINERVRFEIILDSTTDINVRTKALVIFGKLINLDPSRKVLSYQDEDEANVIHCSRNLMSFLKTSNQ